jgi:putative oxidoreductase
MIIHSATLPERLVFGRPEDPDIGDPLLIHLASRPSTALIGRILIALIFAVSGIAKLLDPVGAVAHMQSVGIPYAEDLVYVAGVAEILGALSLLTGFLTRIGALGLILFLIPTTLYFHAFWNYSGQEQVSQMANFMKNVGIMGGLALIVAYGAGRFSLDYAMRRPMEP